MFNVTFSFQNNLHKKTIIFNFRLSTKWIAVSLKKLSFKSLEIENGVLGLERDVYLSIVKFLDSSILRKVWVNIFFFLFFYLCFL
jgi:hypothetical protein